jgi:hypothetical protein
VSSNEHIESNDSSNEASVIESSSHDETQEEPQVAPTNDSHEETDWQYSQPEPEPEPEPAWE